MLLPCLSFWPSSSTARKPKNHKKNDAVSNIKPGETDVKMIPINRMVPRSFVTNIASGHKVKAAPPTTSRGITFRWRLRRGERRLLHRSRPQPASDAAWERRRQIWIAAVAGGLSAAHPRWVQLVDPPHQHQRCAATRHAELESCRLYAQCGGIDRYHCGLRECRRCFANCCWPSFSWAWRRLLDARRYTALS